MSRRLITSTTQGSGGGGSVICENICVTSAKATTFQSANCCKLAQWELIDCCDGMTMTNSATFDYGAENFAEKYDLICFYIAHPVGVSCTVTCLHLRFNGTTTGGGTSGCNSTCAYFTTCDASGNMCVSCTHKMDGYNCSPSFANNTYSGVLYPWLGRNAASNAPNTFLSVGYDFRNNAEPGYYWRGEGVNRGMVICGCNSAGWQTLSGLFLCQNCSGAGRTGFYRFYGRLCQTLE